MRLHGARTRLACISSRNCPGDCGTVLANCAFGVGTGVGVIAGVGVVRGAGGRGNAKVVEFVSDAFCIFVEVEVPFRGKGGNLDASWASVNLGVFLCIDCAGVHRGLGVGLSRVMSTKMDSWRDEWIETCSSVGNLVASKYYEHGNTGNCDTNWDE